ncbi:MAG: hypothetical protein DWQ07_26025 [Chloroflexi bacterium]|nr:MAG: hypothetical protein DWQ07_26025 [Chloroflexota bacterium]
MIIRDKRTDETIDTGNRNPRLSKLARRVYAFSEAIKKLEDVREFDMKMITLTYAPGRQWQKNHVRDYLRAMRREIKSSLLAYAWVAELQKRGAVHYHLYCIVEPGTRISRPDESGQWPHGMSRIERGRSVFYIATYTSKHYQKVGHFPKGLRMYAVWIRKGLLSERDHWIFRLSSYPKWLSDQILEKGDLYLGCVPQRRKEGGWEIEHPRSIPGHRVMVPFFSPYVIMGIPYLSRGSDVHTDD